MNKVETHIRQTNWTTKDDIEVLVDIWFDESGSPEERECWMLRFIDRLSGLIPVSNFQHIRSIKLQEREQVLSIAMVVNHKSLSIEHLVGFLENAEHVEPGVVTTLHIHPAGDNDFIPTGYRYDINRAMSRILHQVPQFGILAHGKCSSTSTKIRDAATKNTQVLIEFYKEHPELFLASLLDMVPDLTAIEQQPGSMYVTDGVRCYAIDKRFGVPLEHISKPHRPVSEVYQVPSHVVPATMRWIEVDVPTPDAPGDPTPEGSPDEPYSTPLLPGCEFIWLDKKYHGTELDDDKSVLCKLLGSRKYVHSNLPSVNVKIDDTVIENVAYFGSIRCNNPRIALHVLYDRKKQVFLTLYAHISEPGYKITVWPTNQFTDIPGLDKFMG